MVGPDTIPIDTFVRLIGLPRAADEHMKHIGSKEAMVLENYAAGINKVAENIVVYPTEFQIT